MGYLDENLVDGEKVTYRTKLHWAVLLWPLIIILVGFSSPKEAAPGILVVGFIAFVLKGIELLTSEFGVTNQRTLIKVGLIARRTAETPLAHIEGIRVDQNILGRILGYGTVIISGSGGLISPFKKVNDPFVLREHVQKQVATAQKKGE